MDNSISIPLWLYIALSLGAPFLGFVGVIVSSIWSNKRNREVLEVKIDALKSEFEDREKSRQFVVGHSILPKMLDSMQKIFEYTMEINAMIPSDVFDSQINQNNTDDFISERDKIFEKFRQIRKWYDQNCFYIPKDIRNSFLILLNLAQNKDLWFQFWTKLIEAIKNLENMVDLFLSKYSLIRNDDFTSVKSDIK